MGDTLGGDPPEGEPSPSDASCGEASASRPATDAAPGEGPVVLEVPGALAGERVDRALALLTGLTRRQANDLIDAGQVRLGRQVVSSHSRRVRPGDRLGLAVRSTGAAPGPPPADPTVAVPVVWHDDDVVVVDKPPGVVVHPGAGNPDRTLVNGLVARFPDLAALAEAEGGRDRPGIVHRLDKGTSGLLVVARTPSARDALIEQLAGRTVERVYDALVAGHVEADAGLVDAPLGRAVADPTRVAVVAAGRPARTRYRVVGRYDTPTPATLLECRLETGRTHQIRVHLASIGHPVVGDERYGGRGVRLLRGWQPLPPGRAFLHARALAFDHPRSGERLRFTAPWPDDLARAAAELGPLPPVS